MKGHTQNSTEDSLPSLIVEGGGITDFSFFRLLLTPPPILIECGWNKKHFVQVQGFWDVF